MFKPDDATPSRDRRQQDLVTLLRQRGEVAVETLAEYFAVSTMTIRRDLQELADRGRVMRTHGGAAPTARVSFEFRFLQRAHQHASEKNQIAQCVAELVQPGQRVLLDSGTTTLAIARHLRSVGPLTVITTSLPIASELYGDESIEVMLLGGLLRQNAPDLCGPITERTLEMLRGDVAFVGADAVDDAGYVYSDSSELPQMLRRITEAADLAYFVADHSKLGRRALMRFGHLQGSGGLITDEQADPELLDTLRATGANVLTPQAIKMKART
jgi:DeoR/GlpR family transcriptional regulator of sugar metabolism